MTIDISIFYLKTPMAQQEYMRLKTKDIPEEILNNTNSKTLRHQMVTYTVKSKKECTDYHNPAY